MSVTRLSDKADLNIYYEADMARYEADAPIRQIVTKERFIAVYSVHPSRGFVIDGTEVGGVIFDGNTAHVAVLPQYHGRWALLIEPGLKWLFSLQRVIHVRVRTANTKVVRFLERCGWPCVKQEEEHLTFEMRDHPDLFFHRRAKAKSREMEHA